MDAATFLRWLPAIVAVVAALLAVHRAVVSVRAELDARITKRDFEAHLALEAARFAEIESQVHKGSYDLAQAIGSVAALHSRMDSMSRAVEIQYTMLLENTRLTGGIANAIGVTTRGGPNGGKDKGK